MFLGSTMFMHWLTVISVKLTPLKKGVSVLDTDTTPTLVTTFNLFIFSNYYWCWRVSVMSRVCVCVYALRRQLHVKCVQDWCTINNRLLIRWIKSFMKILFVVLMMLLWVKLHCLGVLLNCEKEDALHVHIKDIYSLISILVTGLQLPRWKNV